MKKIETQVLRIIRRLCSVSDIYSNLSDCGCNELDLVEILLSIEIEFDVLYKNEEKIKTVKDLLDVIYIKNNNIRKEKFKRLDYEK